MWYKTHVLPLQFQYATLSYHIFKKKYNHTQSILRKSPPVSLNFCTIWKVNSNFYLLATLGIFGNFFSLIFYFQKQFSIYKTKKLVWQLKMDKKQKNGFQNSICERNRKHAEGCFQFLDFKIQWKHAFNLINLSHLMS